MSDANEFPIKKMSKTDGLTELKNEIQGLVNQYVDLKSDLKSDGELRLIDMVIDQLNTLNEWY